ncbi:MAG: HlyD family efflux transporter periplasmic adaptor subunit [Pseudomonadota bacterium]|nr:HlyD family efflux transporter periplasmic adaptor subunit [Pseudomonadota bacterium]
MNQSLFRPEVLAERQTQWLGTVLLAPRLSHRVFTAFAVCATAALLSLLFFADYTRKERINGWLVPQQGLIRVFALQAGVVTQLLVREGTEVRKGMPLLVLSTELQSVARGATQAEIARQLAARHDSLVTERGLHHTLHEQQMRALSDRLIALRAEQEHLDREIDLQRERVKLAEQTTARLHQMRERGFISVQQLQQQEEGRLDQAVKLGDLERDRAATKRERVTLEGELRDLPLKSRKQVGEIERNIAALEQELAEAEARRQIVIPAPQDGTVTAIQAEPGGSANVTAPLLSIVPAGTKLEAHLLSPSRGIGFLRSGQRVLLRYQAYPYQKFGHYVGVVDNVSRSAVNPGELPPQLSGLTSLYGANELVYRITVSLASQTVTAYGNPVPLQSGMQLEADVVIESRRIFEWVLEPLYTLTGKWQK